MTTEAQTFPEDIFQTACGIVMNAKSLKSMLRHKDVVDAIALALIAERERCAAIAESNAKTFDFQKALADCDDAGHGHNSARLQIAVDIRHPKGGA